MSNTPEHVQYQISQDAQLEQCYSINYTAVLSLTFGLLGFISDITIINSTKNTALKLITEGFNCTRNTYDDNYPIILQCSEFLHDEIVETLKCLQQLPNASATKVCEQVAEYLSEYSLSPWHQPYIPVITGLIAAVVGLAAGVTIDYCIKKKKQQREVENLLDEATENTPLNSLSM